MREVVIFGNGVGMALNADSYRLEAALKTAWENPAAMNDAQRQMMKSCIITDDLIEDDIADYPRSEAELGALQRVVAACDIICQTAKQNEHWLTPAGKDFPDQIRSFVHRTAYILYDQKLKLPPDFIEPLKSHVLSQRSHIATLNYDKLI